MANKQIKSYYDNLSSVYDKDHTRGYFEFINCFEFESIIPLAKGKSVLEVGCGTGIILKRVAKIASKAVGVDISDEMISASKKKGLNVKKADVSSLPFKNNEFDVTYAVKVIAHVPNVRKAFSEMTRVVKKDGFVVVEFYNSHSLKKALKAILPTKTFTKYHSIEEVKELLPSELELVDIKGVMSFVPSRVIFDLFALQYLFAAIEGWASKTFFKRFASYIIFVCKKTGK